MRVRRKPADCKRTRHSYSRGSMYVVYKGIRCREKNKLLPVSECSCFMYLPSLALLRLIDHFGVEGIGGSP
jgi:hypothetical protein